MKTGLKVLLGTLALSTPAFSEAKKTDTEFEIGKPSEVKPVIFQADYHIGLIHNDNGLLKTEDDTPNADTTIDIEKFRFQFKGSFSEDIAYRLRYNAASEKVDFAYIRWFVNDDFTVSAGRGWVAQGGPAYFSSSLSRFYLPSAYQMNLPFGPYKEMFQFDYLNKKIGNFTMQVFDDQVTNSTLRKLDIASSSLLTAEETTQVDALLAALAAAGGDASLLPPEVQAALGDPKTQRAIGVRTMQNKGILRNYNQWNAGGGTHPTFAFMYLTQLMNGKLKPMLQYGSYDNNHSMWYSVGTFLNFDMLSGFVGYSSDARSSKIYEDDKPKDEVDTLTNLDVELKLRATKKITPYVYYNMFDRKEGADDQVEGNLPTSVSSAIPGASPWTDNGTTIAVGVEYMVSKHVNLYAAYHSVSGDFYKDGDSTFSEIEKKTQNTMRIGLFGKY